VYVIGSYKIEQYCLYNITKKFKQTPRVSVDVVKFTPASAEKLADMRRFLDTSDHDTRKRN